jgi:hypothetical protein
METVMERVRGRNEAKRGEDVGVVEVEVRGLKMHEVGQSKKYGLICSTSFYTEVRE